MLNQEDLRKTFTHRKHPFGQSNKSVVPQSAQMANRSSVKHSAHNNIEELQTY